MYSIHSLGWTEDNIICPSTTTASMSNVTGGEDAWMQRDKWLIGLIQPQYMNLCNWFNTKHFQFEVSYNKMNFKEWKNQNFLGGAGSAHIFKGPHWRSLFIWCNPNLQWGFVPMSPHAPPAFVPSILHTHLQGAQYWILGTLATVCYFWRRAQDCHKDRCL